MDDKPNVPATTGKVVVKDEPQTAFLPPQTGGSYVRKPDGSLELTHRTSPPEV